MAGATFALPGADSATKDGYALAGWSDMTATYAPGATFTVLGGTDLSFAAVWQPDYASALDCKDTGLTFLSGGDAEWVVQSDKASAGATAIRSGAIGGSGTTASSACSSWVKTTVTGAGTLSFDWAVSCDDGYNGEKYAWAAYSVNGGEPHVIYGRADASWRSVSIELPDGENVVSWTFDKVKDAYNASSGQAGEDCAWLDNVKWTPAEYKFTVDWSADSGVLGAMYSIEDGDQDVAAENGVAIAVPDGKAITVAGLADTNNWYYIVSGAGTFTAEGSTTIVAAKRDPATPVTAAEVGLSADGAFGNADSNEVAKVMSWAQTNGKTVSDVNAMTFSETGDAVGDDAAAYLLDCAPDEIAAESANFKVTSISVDGEGNVTLSPADGSVYGNGHVEARYSETPDGEYTTEKTKGNSCFIRLFLVK